MSCDWGTWTWNIKPCGAPCSGTQASHSRTIPRISTTYGKETHNKLTRSPANPGLRKEKKTGWNLATPHRKIQRHLFLLFTFGRLIETQEGQVETGVLCYCSWIPWLSQQPWFWGCDLWEDNVPMVHAVVSCSMNMFCWSRLRRVKDKWHRKCAARTWNMWRVCLLCFHVFALELGFLQWSGYGWFVI